MPRNLQPHCFCPRPFCHCGIIMCYYCHHFMPFIWLSYVRLKACACLSPMKIYCTVGLFSSVRRLSGRSNWSHFSSRVEQWSQQWLSDTYIFFDPQNGPPVWVWPCEIVNTTLQCAARFQHASQYRLEHSSHFWIKVCGPPKVVFGSFFFSKPPFSLIPHLSPSSSFHSRATCWALCSILYRITEQDSFANWLPSTPL